MNIFYASSERINDNIIELSGQEAVHATKALRYSRGDVITVVDGAGGWYEGEVASADANRVQIAVQKKKYKNPQKPRLTLALGIIKKKDRLEFAVEKAVELGVQEIALFTGQHSVKQNVRNDRLEAIILSAMKQSLQCWLPKLTIYRSLKEVINAYADNRYIVAHQEGDTISMPQVWDKGSDNYVLWVGPEGGLSEAEIDLLRAHHAKFIKLGPNRLRAETAVASFVSVFRSY